MCIPRTGTGVQSIPPDRGDVPPFRATAAHRLSLAAAMSARTKRQVFWLGRHRLEIGLPGFPVARKMISDSSLTAAGPQRIRTSFPIILRRKTSRHPFASGGSSSLRNFLCCLYYKTQPVRLSIPVGRFGYDFPKNIQISPRLFGQVAPAHRACGARAYPRRTGRVCGARRRRSAWPAGPAAPVSKSLRSGRRPRACRPR